MSVVPKFNQNWVREPKVYCVRQKHFERGNCLPLAALHLNVQPNGKFNLCKSSFILINDKVICGDEHKNSLQISGCGMRTHSAPLIVYVFVVSVRAQVNMQCSQPANWYHRRRCGWFWRLGRRGGARPWVEMVQGKDTLTTWTWMLPPCCDYSVIAYIRRHN